MSHPSDSPTPRRDFLGQMAASAIVLAGTACAAPATLAQSTGTQAPSPMTNAAPATAGAVHWDDSWFGRLKAKHRAVFDSPEMDDGLALSQAAGYIRGMRDALGAGPNDVQTVIVMRHHGIPMAFNDAMWAKYAIGEERKVKEGEQWATHNPWAGTAPRPPRQGGAAAGSNSAAGTDAAASNAGGVNGPAADRPQGNLAWLASHGQILLGCDMATRGFAGTLATKVKGDSHAIYEELKANVVTGVILQPTGVYAAHRAQEAGCSYIRST